MASINAKLLEQKKAFNYHWIGLEHQHGHRDIMCKRSEQCYANSFFFLFSQAGAGRWTRVIASWNMTYQHEI